MPIPFSSFDIANIYNNKAFIFNKNGSVAQLEERDVNTVKVLGSSPGRIIYIFHFFFFGFL